MSQRKHIEELAGTCDDDETELLGRLMAEYSDKINQLRAGLLWIYENSDDSMIINRAFRELRRP